MVGGEGLGWLELELSLLLLFWLFLLNLLFLPNSHSFLLLPQLHHTHMMPILTLHQILLNQPRHKLPILHQPPQLLQHLPKLQLLLDITPMVNRREQPLQKFQSFIADRHSVGDGDLMDDFVDAVGGEALVFYFLEG